MSSHVEHIKERLAIHDVIASYIKIEKAGSAFKARCPFHNEKTPSFFISPDRGTFYCFGCGVKGDIFSFVEQFENVDFRGALKILAERAGVVLTPENPHLISEKEKLFRIMEYATKVYEKKLEEKVVDKNDEKKSPLDYIRGRGLTNDTIAEWRIGYAPSQWSILYDLLKNKASDQDIEKAGLIKKREGARGYYDRFRGRIMFPFFDPSGRVVAFSGRYFEGQDDSAKYLNSPETPLFHKSSFLYGYHKAKNAIRLADYAILVEGQMDLIMCHQSGFAQTVATSGTSLTPEHLDILRRMTSHLVLAFDGDKAGMRASTRAWEMALSKGMTVSILALPDGLDPADALLRDKSIFEKALAEREHIIDFHLNYIVAQLKEHKDSRATALSIKNVVIPYVTALESSIEQSHFIKKIVEATGIAEQALWEDVKKSATQAINSLNMSQQAPSALSVLSSHTQTNSSDINNRRFSPVRTLLGVMYWQQSLPAEQRDSRCDHNQIYEKIKSLTDIEYLEKQYESIRDELIFEAEAYYGNSQRLVNDLDTLYVNFELDSIKEKFEKAMKMIAQAEKEGDRGRVSELTAEVHLLSKRLAELRKKS